MFPFFFSDPATKIASLSLQPFTLSWVIERGFFVMVFFFYFGFSYRTIHQYQQRIKDIFSNLEKVKLDWLRNLLLAFGVIWVIALLRFLTAYGKVGYENKYIVPFLLCLTIFLIGWYALRQPEIFSDRWDNRLNRSDNVPDTGEAVPTRISMVKRVVALIHNMAFEVPTTEESWTVLGVLNRDSKYVPRSLSELLSYTMPLTAKKARERIPAVTRAMEVS